MSSDSSLVEELYEFVSHTVVSSAVLAALSRETRPVESTRIHLEVQRLSGVEVPLGEVECALYVLRDAHVVASNNGSEEWSLTETGRALAERLAASPA